MFVSFLQKTKNSYSHYWVAKKAKIYLAYALLFSLDFEHERLKYRICSRWIFSFENIFWKCGNWFKSTCTFYLFLSLFLEFLFVFAESEIFWSSRSRNLIPFTYALACSNVIVYLGWTREKGTRVFLVLFSPSLFEILN